MWRPIEQQIEIRFNLEGMPEIHSLSNKREMVYRLFTL